MIRINKQRISTLNLLHLSPVDEDSDVSPEPPLLRAPATTETRMRMIIR